ncbi:MAG: NADH-quinone oxidoreductase subunit N [Candidatus Humimicrobiaceae bacterium]
MNIDIFSLIPEVIAAFFAFLVLTAGVFIGKRFDKAAAPLAALGLLASAGAVLWFDMGRVGLFFNFTYSIEGFSVFFKIFALIVSIIIILLSPYQIRKTERIKNHVSEFYFLVMLITIGTMLISSANDLIMLFISIELVSMPSYILAGFEKSNKKSVEASLKYFLLGVLASAIMVYGFSLIFGVTKEINLLEISRVFNESYNIIGNPLLITGIMMSLTGFAFKIAAVPFHFWAPDTYEGSPTIVTLVITSIVKISAFAGLIRFLYIGLGNFGASIWVVLTLAVFSVLSMLLGNISALPQKNFKRLMAYSSISHGGFILIGFTSSSSDAQWAILIYIMAYILMNIGAFAVAMIIEGETGSGEVSAFAGLGHLKPFLAITMTIFLVSMVGLPPFAGFIGKLFVFQAGISSHYVWLVIIGVITTVVSLYYYMSIVKQMFFSKAEDLTVKVAASVKIPVVYLIIIGFCAVLTLLMVIVPSIFIAISKSAIAIDPFNFVR